jgi:hypothetical protein
MNDGLLRRLPTALALLLTLGALGVASAEPCRPLAHSELTAMSNERLSSEFCTYEGRAGEYRVASNKYSNLLLKDNPSPVYKKSYEEAESGLQECLEQIRSISMIFIQREEALPSCSRLRSQAF